MATRERQELITDIVSTILEEPAQTKIKFDWFKNKHLKEHFGDYYSVIEDIFKTLNGDKQANQTKRTIPLECDAYFGGGYNFILEFDEYQHFSTARLQALNLFPESVHVNFPLADWKYLCEINRKSADNYRRNKNAVDFNFTGGRTAQRAYLDCFRDLLPLNHGLKPTLRINDYEVSNIFTNNAANCKQVEKIIESRLK